MMTLTQTVQGVQDIRTLLEVHQDLGEMMVEFAGRGDMKAVDELQRVRDKVGELVKSPSNHH